MDWERKKKLAELSSDKLSDALIKLAEHDDMAERLVERFTSEPEDIIKSFRRKISGLKRSLNYS
jgi:hypothetical protein